MSDRAVVLCVSPAVGLSGAAKSWSLVLAALREDFEVWTCAPRPWDLPGIDPARHLVAPSPLISRRFLGNLVYFLGFPYVVLRYALLILRHRVNIVHVNGIYLWQPMLAAKLCGRTLVTHVREDKDKYPPLLYRAWVAYCSLLSDLIICVSAADRLNFARKDVLHIPNWISVPDYEAELRAGSDIGARFDAHGHRNAVKLVVVSQLIQGKGQDFALDILAELRARGRDVCLYLAGGTNDNANNMRYRERLVAQVERLGLGQSVVFLGQQAKVLPLMERFDFCLMPSRAESFSRVHLEAMFARCLLVATDVGSTRDLVEDMKTGAIISHGDVSGAADAIEKLMDDPSVVARMREAARRKVVELYGDGRQPARFREAMRALAGKFNSIRAGSGSRTGPATP